MRKKIEIAYITDSETSGNEERIVDILSDGVYEYLKRNRDLWEDSKLDDRVKSLLDKTKKLMSSEDEKDEESG